jgi:hypothetical protein
MSQSNESKSDNVLPDDKSYEMQQVEYAGGSVDEEKGKSGDSEIPYPDTLKAMPEAPTIEMLRKGFELQKQDQTTPRE